jgi:hypothetical protein
MTLVRTTSEWHRQSYPQGSLRELHTLAQIIYCYSGSHTLHTPPAVTRTSSRVTCATCAIKASCTHGNPGSTCHDTRHLEDQYSSQLHSLPRSGSPYYTCEGCTFVRREADGTLLSPPARPMFTATPVRARRKEPNNGCSRRNGP